MFFTVLWHLFSNLIAISNPDFPFWVRERKIVAHQRIKRIHSKSLFLLLLWCYSIHYWWFSIQLTLLMFIIGLKESTQSSTFYSSSDVNSSSDHFWCFSIDPSLLMLIYSLFMFLNWSFTFDVNLFTFDVSPLTYHFWCYSIHLLLLKGLHPTITFAISPFIFM